MTGATRRSAAFAGLMVLGAGAIAGAVWVTIARAGAPGEGPPAKDAAATAAIDPMTERGQALLERAHVGRRHTPSPLIIPDQSIPLRFAHDVHLGIKLVCSDCHASVRQSLRASDVNLPTEAQCLDCHDIEDPKASPPASCATCHPGFVPEWLPGADRSDTAQVVAHPPAVRLPPPNIKFNHKIHLDRGTSCATCHGDMGRVALATRDNALPLMGTCLGCHDGKQASSECKTCHLTVPDGRIDTRLLGQLLEPAGWYFDDAHGPGWIEGHRVAAAVGEAHCANCHTSKDCIDCHSGVSKPLAVHPNNWIIQHPIAARKNVPDCQSCHRTQTFCVDCHQATRVVVEQPNRPPEQVSFHGDLARWVGTKGARSAGHHSFEAQRNIRACASCHTEASCMRCHAVTGLSVNPHPPGFVGSGACARMAAKNPRACVKCHEGLPPCGR